MAIARVLLKQPAWVFADEATSALDKLAEETLYQRLMAMVQKTHGALVSIAHRPTVAAFHNKTWLLEPLAEGSAARYELMQKSLTTPTEPAAAAS